MTFTFLEGFAFQRLVPPQGLAGWVVWVLLAGLVAWLLWRLPHPKMPWTRKEWGWLLAFALLTPISIVLITLRLPAAGSLPIPALGSPPMGSLIPILAAIPWVLALGLLGPLPGVALAILSGGLLALWDTRSPFTPIEYALVAALFAAALAQPYRTRLFDWLRQPVVAALALSVIYPFLFLVTSFFWASSDPVSSLDFALSRLPMASISVAVPLLLAAGALQTLRARSPLFAKTALVPRPSPGERSLEARLLFTLGPVVLLAFLLLGALAWWSAGRTAEQLLGERVRANRELAAESVPFLLETGQNLILQLAADTRLADAATETASALLQDHLRAVPYFEQLILLDTGGNTVAGFPVGNFTGLQPSTDEIAAVSRAIQGISFQTLSISPQDAESRSARLSFVAAVRNENDQVRAVLLGRTALTSNPFAQPILQSLTSVNTLGGLGYLLDGNGTIVIAPDATAVMQPYNGRGGANAVSYEDLGPDGSRRFVDYLPVTGSNWAVVTVWPARLSQQLALELALPILFVLLLLAVAAYLLLRFSLRSVNSSLQALIGETNRIAAGDLGAPLSVQGADELGRLSAAFDSMRQTLQARAEEIQRLLSVSQGLSSTLDVSAHIEPILEAALASGASSARLVFAADADGKRVVGFGRGGNAKAYQGLDVQVDSMSRKQNRVLLANPARARLKVAKGEALPQTIAAFALRHNDEHLGALWLAYESPQIFTAEKVHYLETLADQAAKAAVNARLYTRASAGRQRLEAVLEASPEATLVLEQGDRVVFGNSAARQALGLQNAELIGVPLSTLVRAPQLFSVIGAANSQPESVEIEIGDVEYEAAVTSLRDKAEMIGTVVRLRNLSEAKQAEAARADFLSTVSHDLHDPLKLTKGYLNMLGMVGDLNEQQAGYVEKIDHSLENISRLAANLLDLERVSGLKGLQVQAFSVEELIQEVFDELGARARQKRIDFSAPTIGGAQPLEADRTLLQRALYNLVDNAVKFSARETVVEVKTTYSKDKVILAVTDRGPGIAPLDLPAVFGAKPVKGRKSSGLVIVKSVIERHAGRVWVESELGTGSTFYCELPLTPPMPAKV
ncbi:MAG: ATP-binding protein [Anaerolineales bacterium]